MTSNFNPFHLLDLSPWPIIASGGILTMASSGVIYISNASNSLMLLSATLVTLISVSWWRDVHRESTSQGNHPNLVTSGLKTGMLLFIASEILFFVSFFWGFFHSSVSPSIEIGQMWPPQAISPFNPISIPLLNTILLVSSGVSVTWSHHEILNANLSNAKSSLNITILIGAVFSLCQGTEYATAPFSISDSSFGSSFFMATGFHGIHVIVGSIFLAITLMRMGAISNSNDHLVGFECAAWYWHFVDVVWLFLYSIIYWWGS